MKLSSSVLVASLAASAVASPIINNHVLHETRASQPKFWTKRDRLPGHVKLPFRIGLTQQNLHIGHDLLMEISDPASPRYGQHYTAEEVIEIFAPAAEAVDSVSEWLHDHGISKDRVSQSANKQWMQWDGTIGEAEKLFKTQYHSWRHTSGKNHVACDEYHVPSHIQHHIDYITPGIKLISGGNRKKVDLKKRDVHGPVFGKKYNMPPNPTIAELLDMCDSVITPPCIKALYNITDPTLAADGNELGIFEEGDFYVEEDLVLFFETLAPQIPATTMPILRGIDGGFAPGAVAGGESDLDFQISYPIIYPQNSVLYQTDDFFYATGLNTNATGFLNTFLDAIDGSYCTYSAFGETGDSPIDPKYPDPNPAGYQGERQCGVYKPTNVISISYGEQEDDIPTNYQQRQCSEFMKLGMQGTTTVIASGDSGVAARSTDDGNANGCLGSEGTVFNPDFPASCPYITALGSTFLPTGGDVNKDEEISTTRFPSGGGFSNIYAQPSYQSSNLDTYFTDHDPGYTYYNTSGTNNPSDAVTGGNRYNRGGRGYPDAAAIGDNVLVYVNGVPELIGGTSASAPVFASIINRVNEERIAAGKGPVGFVNPTLYANPQMFNDITNGTNPGCGTDGFFAVPGWDPVSGLGTPNYPQFLEVFMALP